MAAPAEGTQVAGEAEAGRQVATSVSTVESKNTSSEERLFSHWSEIQETASAGYSAGKVLFSQCQLVGLQHDSVRVVLKCNDAEKSKQILKELATVISAFLGETIRVVSEKTLGVDVSRDATLETSAESPVEPPVESSAPHESSVDPTTDKLSKDEKMQAMLEHPAVLQISELFGATIVEVRN